MRVLLSTIGSRGDVQPLVALATRLTALGHRPRVCAPPDFAGWIAGLGIAFVPIGPPVRPTAKPGSSAGPGLPTPEQRRQMVAGTVAAQFETLPAAADGCDVIVAATAIQVAARSVAEQRGIRYVYASYCPTALPSPHHPPPVLTMLGDTPTDGSGDNRALWAADAERINSIWAEPLNAHRAALGLSPVDDVRGHMFTDAPWLAADPALAPWPGPEGVFQTGAWLLPDPSPLPAELAEFLDAGEPPVYFGFGSIRAPEDLGRTMIESARALGRRAILSRGWADLAPLDGERDCLAIGDVNQPALFGRVAAVVHHGGAGTTTAATRAGAPQVVIPQHYDQHYFARRVGQLGIGVAHAPGAPSTESLTAALRAALEPEVAARAKPVADGVRADGAEIAAQRLIGEVPGNATG
jgi:vancomycin aglycone glucosyltransferase